jgi:hypothetical protein
MMTEKINFIKKIISAWWIFRVPKRAWRPQKVHAPCHSKMDITLQGLPGDGIARQCPQNDPWGVVNSARKKKKLIAS